MKTIGIIPARYASTRLPGKPLADICGKPMIWWVYQQAKKATRLDYILVAVDDDKVIDVCNSLDIPAIMTSDNHTSHFGRLHEVATMVESDLYVCICGDEPLVQAATIEQIIPNEDEKELPFIARSLMRVITDPAELVDPSNLKVVTDKNGYGLMVSRGIIPYPHKTVMFDYTKVVGIECYNKAALDFFVSTPSGFLEGVEDTNLLRFIENRKLMKFVMTKAYQLSVDTQHDLDKVRKIIQGKLDNEGWRWIVE